MNSNEALGLPKGSIRAILALALVGAVVGLAAFGVPIPEGLWSLAGAGIAYYFAQKRTV